MKKVSGEACGIPFELDTEVLDNMELVDALAELDAGNTLAISAVSRLMLGPELKQRIYAKLKAENNGVVRVEAFTAVIEGIFDALGDDGKKS